ncbi:MAG: PAS domain-containing protein, partial [Candidatus Odinarchaeota archaeon]
MAVDKMTETRDIEGILFEHQILFDSVPVMIWYKDTENNLIKVNKLAAAASNLKPEDLNGKSCHVVYPEEADGYYQDDLEVINSGKPKLGIIEHLVTASGEKRWVKTNKLPYLDKKGNIKGVIVIAIDITELKNREDIIQKQTQEISELSTPVMEVLEGVVAVSLIGTLDSQRTQQFMEALLNNIVKTKAEVALVDITGVPMVDTQTAQHLVETVMAGKLVGAKVILTGIRPVIAQTLVHLGIDLSAITTCSSLAAGLKTALNILGLEIISVK